MSTTTKQASLTGDDRRVIASARELAAARNFSGSLRDITRTEADAPSGMVYSDALGVADYLLLELVAIIERMEGSQQ